MPVFAYTARNNQGGTVTGSQDAKDEKFLASLLRVRGLSLVKVRTPAATAEKKRFSLNITFGRVPVVEKIVFLQNLQVMVRTGFSLGHALDVLAQQTEHKGFQKIIKEICSEVESGITFSAALAKYPKVFPELFVNMVAAGEVSGKLDEVLLRLMTQLKKDHQLIAKVRGALMYPMIVIIAMIVLGTAMMIFVIPKLLGVFNESGGTLPLPTRILMGISNFMQHYIFFLIPGVIALIILFRWWIHTPKGRMVWHHALLRFPIVGPILKKINLARFTRTLSSLLRTDIPIVQTFQIIAKTMGNVVFRKSLNETAEELKKGSSIAKVLISYPELYPPVVSQMVSVGEESGTLDTISEEIAKFYEEEVDQVMSNLTSILEPILILILGGGVGGIVVAVILPIYSLTDQIN
jgi:type IV pilus assembly protein PilC